VTAAGDNRGAFDARKTYAQRYLAELSQGIGVSGDDAAFFARGRVSFLRRELGARWREGGAVLDYGCGIGTAFPFLLSEFRPSRLTGLEVSREALEAAAERVPVGNISLRMMEDFSPNGGEQLVYCNGVLHHVPPASRSRAVEFVSAALAPGGCFALFENNPWNPGARLVMRRIPFDRDAVMLSSREARRLLEGGGFRVLAVRYLFFFPSVLRALRPLERLLKNVPLGAQYMVLGRKA